LQLTGCLVWVKQRVPRRPGWRQLCARCELVALCLRPCALCRNVLPPSAAIVDFIQSRACCGPSASAVERSAPVPPAMLPDGCFLGPLGGAPPGGFPLPPFFCTPIDASADVITVSSTFISCIPAADPLDEDACAAAFSSPVT
jgi:hypothetical protein